MDSTDYRVAALLTEHLGFAPLTLIDEVINDVNQIMYNCTDALERFLTKRRDSQLASSALAFPAEEIRNGAAELETLLVLHVDRNFDKFELYTLRNILTLPRDLVEGGWIRLKHHEDIELPADGRPDTRVAPLVASINLELQLRQMLLLQKERANKIVALLRQYKACVELLTLAGPESRLLKESAELLRQLQPMNENLYYLLGQVDALLKQVLRLNDKFMKDETLRGMQHARFGASARDTYIREKSLRILEEIGVVKAQTGTVVYSAYADTTNGEPTSGTDTLHAPAEAAPAETGSH